MDAIGRRVERLLYLSAPMSFAAFIVLFIALAIDSNQGRFERLCHSKLVSVFENNRAELDALFPVQKPSPKYEPLTDYHIRVIDLLLDFSLNRRCYDLVREYSMPYSKLAPADILEDIQKKIKERTIEPLSYLGAELPEKATIDVFGTKVSVELQTFLALLQVVLCPVLLIWLGSLLNSRATEIGRIVATTDPTKVFPHVVNTYAGVLNRPSRRKAWLQRHFPIAFAKVGPTWYSVREEWRFLVPALVRILFLGIVVLPPALALTYSLYLVRLPGYDFFYGGISILVLSFAITPIVMEFIPVIYRKRFEYEFLQNGLPERYR
ncbi:MAG: hypothetical protein JNN20_15480 [Betaproteobacteria bacterium]|nr:hypothetical protein [Betaproteobacteria bacterium]